MLDKRKQAILAALVEDFIVTAEPVGSKRLVERYSLDISPATVRKVLISLEEKGYISQPHVSAGRVPTDTGYRFYVDCLTRGLEPEDIEPYRIRRFYAEINHELGRLMTETSHLLSELTKCAGLVCAPNIRKEQVKHVDLVGLGGQEVLVVVITSKGSIAKQVVDIGKHKSAEDLSGLEKILNRVLAGVPVEKVPDGKVDSRGLSEREISLVKRIHAHIVDSLAGDLTTRVYYDGAAYLLAKPEIAMLDRAHEVIDLLEKNYKLLEWLQTIADESEVIVSIGDENQLGIQGLSLVASGYEIEGEPVGVLGILGPTRMDYSRAISAVRSIARSLGDVLTEFSEV